MINQVISQLKVKIKRKENCEDLPLPAYMSNGASGMDLYADVEGEAVIPPGEVRLISAGIYVSIPPGYEAQIRPRSGLALKKAVGVLNSPGTIDADYRGLVSIILINLGKTPFVVHRGDRIAQMVIQKVVRAELETVKELDETHRSTGGFGHTGT